MIRLFMSLLAASLAVTAAATATRAQADGAAPGAGEAKSYVPPPAAKSVEVGNYYLRTKRYNAALSRFEEAAKTDPYYPPAYLGLGKVYEKIGLKQKALAAYQNYLDTLPSTKAAENAKEVHQAMARLERELKSRSRKSRP